MKKRDRCERPELRRERAKIVVTSSREIDSLWVAALHASTLSTLVMAASSSSAAAASDETRNAEELLRSMETYSPIVRRTAAQRCHAIFALLTICRTHQNCARAPHRSPTR